MRRSIKDRILAMAAAQAEDAILVIGRDNKVAAINEVAEKCLGYGRHEIEGQPSQDVCGLIFHESYRSLLPLLLLERDPSHIVGFRAEVVIVRKCGLEFPAELALYGFEDESGYYVTMVLRDLSLRMAQEANRRAAERHEAELRVLRVTMGTVQDLVLNALNSLQFLRVRMEEGQWAQEDLASFDAIVHETAQKILELSSMRSFETRLSDTNKVVLGPAELGPGTTVGGEKQRGS